MLHAVVLAGGGGTRLWPASRRRNPKQLLALGARADESLLAATVRRLEAVVGGPQIWVVTAAEQLAGVVAALPGVPPAQILAEPVGRNTAAAIGLAAVRVAARDPDAVLAAVPADHAIGNEAEYRAVIGRALALAAAEDTIVGVGILPTGPETGFGYLEPGAPGPGGSRVVARFVEKPDRAHAERYVAAGYLWNAGMFFFRARRILGEIARHLPPLAAGLSEIAAGAPLEDVYPTLPSISIDYGVMEKTRDLLVLTGDFGWSDVGSWSALADVRRADAAGNVSAGRLVAVDAHDNIVATDAGLVALVGVSGLVVVRAGNAVLVVPRDRAQDVRNVVAHLAGEEEFT